MANFNEKSKTAYNQIADDYNNSPEGRFTEKFKRLLLANIKFVDGDDVLDVACGNGTLLGQIQQTYHINGFGVDLADRMIANAQKAYPNISFFNAGCESIPLQSNCIDCITVCAAFHHFPDVKAFAAEAGRLLRTGGQLHVAELYFNPILRTLINPFVPLSKSGDVKFYSPKQIAKIFAPFGFTTTNIITQDATQLVSMQKNR